MSSICHNKLLEQRFNLIDAELKKLAIDHDRIKDLSYKYLFLQSYSSFDPLYWLEKKIKFKTRILEYFEPENTQWLKNPQSCGCTAAAIMGLNLFNQKYIKNITSFDELTFELLNGEEGTFDICINVQYFLDGYGNKTYFGGHSLTILKVIENKTIGYRVAQSYANEYFLDQFLSLKTYTFYDFEDLQKRFLDPLKAILFHTGMWGEEQLELYHEITGIKPLYLKDCYPATKNNTLQNDLIIERTTNYKPPRTLSSLMNDLMRPILCVLLVVAVAARILQPGRN